jgi:hypothetical protein
MKRIAALALLCCSFAASLPAEDQLQAEFRGEGERFSKSCIHPMGSFFGAFAGCAQLLFTDHPLHVAVGSLAPQNGFGGGVAFTTHYTPNENWRLFFDLDGIATPNGSWRAGGYMTAVLIRHQKIVVLPGGSSSASGSGPTLQEMPAFHLYAQGISLNKLTYFGLGPNSSQSARSYYGMTETITGANVVWPVFAPANISLFAEANGRFVSLRGNHTETSPSIEQVNNSLTAPGLLHQPAYAQFGQGVRIRPSFANGHVRLGYSIGLQEWVAGDSGASFRRFTTDLQHEFPFYRGSRALYPREFNGPNSCLQDVNAKGCPAPTRNLEGSVSFRFLYTASFTSTGNVIPFYFDPTLGGSDINGTTLLPSYTDYRFRGPNLMLFRAAFEHSIYKWPVGVKFMVDEGRVALTRGDLGFDHLAHSYATGLTVRAGGLPVIELLFAWGGHEGTHNIANVNNSLLGGSARPPLQ